MKKTFNKLAIATLVTAASMSANAFEIESNGWTFSVHGNVNASYISSSCDNSSSVVDGAFLCSGSQEPDAISNGYLPTIIEFGLATQKGGYDVAVHFTFDRGLDTNEAFNGSNSGTSDEGFRIWLDIGNDEIGNVMLGRSWGVFAYDATFQDMTVYGVGGPFFVANPVNTQLGGAGTGYIFMDRITQATWTLPTSDAWVAQVGAYQPLDFYGGGETGSELPGAHGRLRYNFEQGFISSSFITQDVDVKAVKATAASNYTAVAYDITGQFNVDDLSLTASYFKADGLGHTGLFIGAVDPMGKERESDGYYVQGTYTLGSTKLGLNYGVSNLDTTNNDADNTLEEKGKLTAGVYHTLTSGVTVTAEYSKVEAENKASKEIDNDIFSVGAIYFF